MSNPYLGIGLYSLVEASRLTNIPTKRIRRWMEGYTYVDRGERKHSGPVVQSTLGREAGSLALSFADLIEVRTLDAFHRAGVGWREIRIAVDLAREMIGVTHPFSTKRFRTDGRKILADLKEPGRHGRLLHLSTQQWEWVKVVQHTLYKGLDYDDDQPNRWWPMSRRRLVLVDPQRQFGTPIVTDGAVPTYILAASAKAERSQKTAARYFEVSERAVRDAVEFEQSLERARAA